MSPTRWTVHALSTHVPRARDHSPKRARHGPTRCDQARQEQHRPGSICSFDTPVATTNGLHVRQLVQPPLCCKPAAITWGQCGGDRSDGLRASHQSRKATVTAKAGPKHARPVDVTSAKAAKTRRHRRIIVVSSPRRGDPPKSPRNIRHSKNDWMNASVRSACRWR
jgi:hypothetical protein